MTNSKINQNYAVQILNENNNQLEQPYETVKEYAEYSAENDPTFIQWLFGSESNIGDWGAGMTEEQKESYLEFMSNL